jgi:hypothetical protein
MMSSGLERRQMKKPPGEPGGLILICGEGGMRLGQLHEVIMHRAYG